MEEYMAVNKGYLTAKTDKQSDEFDLDVRLAKKMARAKTREQRYGATRKGYAVRMKALRKYEKNHPEKTALWSFKSRIRREKGYDPSEEECRAFLIRRGYLKEEAI